ncbi:MAG: hypothetical protein LQ345_001212 [Seirophora villosa]|nr:MAG: hypothetical protein LQ345_001212 [Seirophora villosa]
MTSTIGIPIKLLNEAQNHVVTLEITSGQVYRGKLIEAEDNMNVQLKDITVTARDGRVSHLDQVYIRGSHVRFFIVPDMLRTESAYADGLWQERADVPLERNTRSRCGYGERKSDSEQGKGPTRSTRWMKHEREQGIPRKERKGHGRRCRKWQVIVTLRERHDHTACAKTEFLKRIHDFKDYQKCNTYK